MACFVLSYSALPPRVKHNYLRADPQTKETFIISIKPNVIELKRRIRAKRCGFYLETTPPINMSVTDVL